MTTTGSTSVIQACFLGFYFSDEMRTLTFNVWIFKGGSGAAEMLLQRKCISPVLPANCSVHFVVLQYNGGIQTLV